MCVRVCEAEGACVHRLIVFSVSILLYTNYKYMYTNILSHTKRREHAKMYVM